MNYDELNRLWAIYAEAKTVADIAYTDFVTAMHLAYKGNSND